MTLNDAVAVPKVIRSILEFEKVFSNPYRMRFVIEYEDGSKAELNSNPHGLRWDLSQAFVGVDAMSGIATTNTKPRNIVRIERAGYLVPNYDVSPMEWTLMQYNHRIWKAEFDDETYHLVRGWNNLVVRRRLAAVYGNSITFHCDIKFADQQKPKQLTSVERAKEYPLTSNEGRWKEWRATFSDNSRHRFHARNEELARVEIEEDLKYLS